MDFYKLSLEVIRALRGKRSQGFMNRRLGLNYNLYYRWETGRRTFYWTDFIDISDLTKTPIEPAVSKILLFSGDARDAGALVRNLTEGIPLKKVAERVGRSESAVSRWRTGATKISFENMMSLIGLRGLHITKFIDYFVDLEDVPEALKAHHRMSQEVRFHVAHPVAAALVEFLATKAYRQHGSHDDRFVAESLGIEIDEEKHILKSLLDMGRIQKDGDRYGRASSSLDTRTDMKGSIKLRKYWLERLLKHLDPENLPSPRTNLGYMVYSSTPEVDKKVLDHYVEFYYKVVATVRSRESESPVEHVQCLNVGFFPVSLPPDDDDPSQKSR